MSDMTLFSSGAALPSHLRRGQLSETTKALMGTGNKRISIEGGSFRLVVGGQEVAVKEERYMNVIVVRAAEHNSRTFYEGTYVKGSKAKPTCWSDDSITPHDDVKNPQSNTCATCPQNIKGSAAQGEGRACRYQRRMAVLLENDVHGDIYALSIPAASIFDNGEGRKMGLQQYARFLGGHGIDINAVVTEMRFDTSATAPKLNFSAVRPLEEAEWNTVVARKDDPAAIDAVTMTVGALDETPGNPVPTSTKTPAPAPAQPAAKAQPKDTGFRVTDDIPVETAKATPKATPKPKAADPVEEVAEPVVREAKPAAGAVPNVNAILADWGSDADD
jgi:hypothetical protein